MASLTMNMSLSKLQEIGEGQRSLAYCHPWGPKEPLIGKDSNAGKDWRQKKKRVTEDEVVR